MKKAFFIFIVTVLSLFSTKTASSQIVFGFNVGIATPNENINDIYNSDRLEQQDFLGNLYREGTQLGYQIGVKGRIPMSEDAAFTGGIAWTRFPETDIEVKDPETDEVLTTLGTNQNIIPISAGLNYYLINTAFGVYAAGELTYNLISNSVDYKGDLDVPIDTSPSDSRVGFGIGAGLDLAIPALFTVNMEGRYNLANLIGKEDGENTKTYFTFTLGIYFGERK